ncbi:hypothetical protein M3223_17960 [Paenibacillus pasadenensis]|uniref:hypothetical protein n=1 Tax=Paenibacillus pasadenensis TaxID=217090 RepID=UPI00203C80E3|nr:hypothetical protein [Paenibacillus pasadenensis]MCM3749247.1 hypothetical protein [Paenibacillus pasadenensis]
MKKTLWAATAALTLLLTACGSQNGSNDAVSGADNSATAEASPASSPAASPSNKDIEVDKGLLKHEITLPAAFFEGQDIDAVLEQAKKDGVNEAVKNADGSVTYTISKDNYSKMLDEMKQGILKSVEELKSGTTFKSVKDVKHNDSLSEFTLIVEQEAYEGSFDSFAAVGLALPAMYYQLFSGAKPDAYNVTIKLQDEKSGTEFNKLVYPDAMKK